MSITRIQVSERMSQAVVHGGLVYTAGQVALSAAGEDVATQTRTILEQIDGLLGAAGTDKTKLISATIWLSDMGDFAAMNEIWDAWVAPGETPARACVESNLASPKFNVEISVIAAVD